jgi:hypothetical protein
MHFVIYFAIHRRPKGDMSGTSVTELVLLKLSTGMHHTSATQPVIYLAETTAAHGHCSVMLEIVGDNLALLLTYRQHLGMRAGPDTFHVYNWRTGNLKAVRLSLKVKRIVLIMILQPQTLPTSHHAYQGFIFLTETVLLVPNLVNKRLEIYIISNTGLIPKCLLDLPPLSPHHIIVMLTCRAEPNPVGELSNIDGIYARDSANPPFVSSPADAIALFNMTVVVGHPVDFSYFSFVVHRSALLRAASVEVSISPMPTPWNGWGPQITRWFDARGIAHGYITTTAG